MPVKAGFKASHRVPSIAFPVSMMQIADHVRIAQLSHNPEVAEAIVSCTHHLPFHSYCSSLLHAFKSAKNSGSQLLSV
jgi:hypothetical protein